LNFLNEVSGYALTGTIIFNKEFKVIAVKNNRDVRPAGIRLYS
jgi:hypothetical protein